MAIREVKTMEDFTLKIDGDEFDDTDSDSDSDNKDNTDEDTDKDGDWET